MLIPIFFFLASFELRLCSDANNRSNAPWHNVAVSTDSMPRRLASVSRTGPSAGGTKSERTAIHTTLVSSASQWAGAMGFDTVLKQALASATKPSVQGAGRPRRWYQPPPSRTSDPHPRVDFGRRRPARLLVPAGFDLVEHGPPFNDIPLNQVPDLLFHGWVVPAGKGLERLNHLDGHIADGDGGRCNSAASYASVLSRKTATEYRSPLVPR